MTRRLLWAALVGAALLATSGCGEVESCDHGEVGCLDGPADPTRAKPCKYGLEANSQGICVKKGQGGGGLPVDECGGCPAGSVCNDLRQCTNVCELPSNLPVVKPKLPSCRVQDNGAPHDFQSASVAACTQECVRRGEYCGTGCDPTTACTPQLATQVLSGMALCPGGNAQCAMEACERARDRPCAQYSCLPATTQPNCAAIRCTNTCAGGFPEFLNDGLCDDGDLSNGESSACAWGSDCGDCGPRRGEPPNMDLGLGDICADPVQCGGDSFDVSNAVAWCVEVETGSLTVKRCLPDCSISQECPAGFVCNDLLYEEAGALVPALDENDHPLRACFSVQCG